MREGRVSSREVVEHHIEAIERVNPTINAVVRPRFGEARREADEADRRLRTRPLAELPPLHGVPCTIKECFALTGMPQTSGLVSRRSFVSPSDATAVARLRRAGAIPLGVTNLSEVCMWMESANRVYGRTNNPYDARRTAGGSSGGEGAIVGAGASPFGLASDIGGSIRGPAFFNGVFGHKPTGGLVPTTGQYPALSAHARRILTTGPIARRAEDLMPLLRILAGPDGGDPGCIELPLLDPAAVDLRSLTVIDVSDEDVPFATTLGDGTPVPGFRELLKWIVGRSDHTFMPLVLTLFEPIARAFRGLSKRFVEMGRRLCAAIDEAIGDHGVILYPVYPTTAPRHSVPILDYLRLRFPSGYQGIFNVLELPSTAVPLGLDRRGLPLGMQVVGPHGGDHLTIASAMALEEALGGWVPPRERAM
jgi:fatty acid amide hydrolase 2